MTILKQELARYVEKHENFSNVLIMGDFNTEADLMEEYGSIQVIQDSTSAGVFGRKLCHAYARTKDFLITGHILYKSFTRSFHHPILAQLEFKNY